MEIAVIGSGIAGLSAAWFLRNRHRVTLYERWPRLGMDAHTVTVDSPDGPLAINVPMRVFFAEYYPVLAGLYDELGVAYEPVQYAGSFSDYGGSTYFRYRNYWLGSLAVPFLAGRSLRSLNGLKLGAELLRLLRRPAALADSADLDAITIDEYLQRAGYSRHFAERFLYPAFAGICTCSYASLRAYPASMILGYLSSGLTWAKVQRLTHGTADLAERLAASASELHLNTKLRAVRQTPAGVEVTDRDGHTRRFDHVVMATQANQALCLLPHASRAERDVLGRFCYEQSRVIVHRDTGLAPTQSSEWAPVNFLLSPEQDKPMASILLNGIHPQLADQAPLFETWNPFRAVRGDDLLLEADVERPVVSCDSLRAIDRLYALHQEAGRRIWFCGSYARRGIPLLESAASSALAVAERLNGMAQAEARAA